MIAHVFKEPLIIFMCLAGAIFVLFQLRPTAYQTKNSEIVVSEATFTSLLAEFEKGWMRLPTEQESDELIDHYIHEEVLVREAIAMALDKNDEIVRRRLRQKMEFLSEDLAQFNEPDEQDLEKYLDKNKHKYWQDSRYSFRHVYFNTTQYGQAARVDALSVLKFLQENDEGIVDIKSLSDSLMMKTNFINVAKSDIQSLLGSQFAQALSDLPVGSWQGPITSGFGIHLVLINERLDGEPPELNNLREVLVRDWTLEQREKSNKAFYNNLRSRYKVKMEHSPFNKWLSERRDRKKAVQMSLNESEE